MNTLALHYDDLVEYIRRRFSGSQFAHDVVHDVCVQLLEKSPQQPIAQPFAFLRRVSFNRAIDRSRSDCARNARFKGMAELPDNRSHDCDGAMALDFEQQLKALLAIIEALPARPRQIFLLHRIHGMPQREIADELGISLNMVTQHFSRAMRAIVLHWEPAQRAVRPRQY
ncbi:RNA polymerase sigma factor [Azomonas macrocytogenes]|uniref:RNA polymerase sigma-70 factor (ECF subfamily) n=1 Tax=Azomonas macrocytogenes TaxID=69962 RepID=A0A839SYW8_AZOMA|nr:RNA polymerase sigma factor [Azomonas macrocytogenes]MBB3101889.1 RNA polymerase sigma-70 factor (ECF subfamily) [Azomonas macrocytogenes]